MQTNSWYLLLSFFAGVMVSSISASGTEDDVEDVHQLQAALQSPLPIYLHERKIRNSKYDPDGKELLSDKPSFQTSAHTNISKTVLDLLAEKLNKNKFQDARKNNRSRDGNSKDESKPPFSIINNNFEGIEKNKTVSKVSRVDQFQSSWSLLGQQRNLPSLTTGETNSLTLSKAFPRAGYRNIRPHKPLASLTASKPTSNKYDHDFTFGKFQLPWQRRRAGDKSETRANPYQEFHDHKQFSVDYRFRNSVCRVICSSHIDVKTCQCDYPVDTRISPQLSPPPSSNLKKTKKVADVELSPSYLPKSLLNTEKIREKNEHTEAQVIDLTPTRQNNAQRTSLEYETTTSPVRRSTESSSGKKSGKGDDKDEDEDGHGEEERLVFPVDIIDLCYVLCAGQVGGNLCNCGAASFPG